MSQDPVGKLGGHGDRLFVRDLTAGQRVDGVFAVRERELRRKRDGEAWLKLKLCDNSGMVEAISWNDAEARYEIARPGAAVMISGLHEVNDRFGATIKLNDLSAAKEGEFDPDDLIPGPDVSFGRMEGDLRELLATIQDLQIAGLLDRFFGVESPIWQRFREAPAAKYYHQAYRHGLLEHSVSVAQAVSAASAFFPGIDREVAVAGALLHDIGKTEAYNDEPMAIDFTNAGRLAGEISLGYYLVRRQIEEFPSFDPHLAEGILHIILSHHGSLEHGSPVVPSTREAVLVHMMDNLGGRLGSFDRLERDLVDGEVWSKFDRALDGSAYFSRRPVEDDPEARVAAQG